MPNHVPVKIKTFDDTVALPQYHSEGAAGFDLSNRVSATIPAHTVQLVPTGIFLDVPNDYWVMLAARSSLHKLGLMLVNGVGVGDPDYRGDEDEYRILLYNFSDQPVTIAKGTRLVQVILMPRHTAVFHKVEQLNNTSRGGIGSTGSK